MLQCGRDAQWAEALSLWVDRKVAAYLKENHSWFEAVLAEQRRLAEKYPVIIPFLDGEGAAELTAEEHHAVKEYLDLREKAELLIREYHYYLGQAMDIPGLQEFCIPRDGEPEAEENRTDRLLDLLAANRVEEADQMLRFSNPEYRARVEMEAEAQKAVAGLQITDQARNTIAYYADAVHGRWLLFQKLFYRYAVEDILGSSRKAGESQDHGRREENHGITGSDAGNGKGQKEQLVQGERAMELSGGAPWRDLEKEKDPEPESTAPI